MFVHFFLTMIAQGFMSPGKAFWAKHYQEHEANHKHDLDELAKISLPAHVEENALARLYRENKYRVKLPIATRNLLLNYLEETETRGGYQILRVLNLHLELVVIPGRTTLFARGGELQEGEGILGHRSGGDLSEDLPPVKLGPLPMDKEMMKEVEEELRDEDTRMRDASRNDELGVAVGSSLVDEFQKIKREGSEDSPMRETVPLPPYTVMDIEREVRLVRESRETISLSGGPSPALPSVCMYTFHNTNDG